MSTTPNFEGQVPRDSDGFYAYAHGGQVNTKFATFAYSEGTADKFFIPRGAEIIGWIANVDTVFDGTGSNVIDIGDATTDNRFGNDISMATETQVVTGFDPDEMFTPTTEEITVRISYRGAGAAAGHLTLACLYIMR